MADHVHGFSSYVTLIVFHGLPYAGFRAVCYTHCVPWLTVCRASRRTFHSLCRMTYRMRGLTPYFSLIVSHGLPYTGFPVISTRCVPWPTVMLFTPCIPLLTVYRQTSYISRTKWNAKTLMFLVSSGSCSCPIHWSQVLSREWGCSWSSADRRCSISIWVINNFITNRCASYVRGFTGHGFPFVSSIRCTLYIMVSYQRDYILCLTTCMLSRRAFHSLYPMASPLRRHLS